MRRELSDKTASEQHSLRVFLPIFCLIDGTISMPTVKALASYVVLGFLALIIILLVRTMTFGPSETTEPECTPLDTDFIAADTGVVDRFRTGLRLQTVSWGVGNSDYAELSKLHTHIRESYPLVHSSNLITVEVVANYSLLYTVKGSEPSLQPYILCAHLDVVPADPAMWHASPWDAEIKDGFIYGRGTIDFKHGVFGILEALEFTLKQGIVPKRPFYVAFGHDEEVMGTEGALVMARLMESRGVKAAFILDEGLPVMNGFLPGMKTPVAGIGLSEKGYATLRLSVDVEGGHSSMPGKESCIGILGRAIARLESNPHPSRFGMGPEISMFEYIAPKFSFPIRVVMSNLWLFGPVVSKLLSGKPQTNALIRTTTAVTQIQGGVKENVIAQTVWATVNHRLHPADTVQQVVEYDRMVIADDRVKIEVVNGYEGTPISPYGDNVYGFEVVRTSIHQVWHHHQVSVAPGLMIGGTDTKHYTNLSDQIYRFSPTYMYPEDAKRFHGLNERISVENYQDAINFYYHVMRNADSATLKQPHHHSADL